MAQENIETLKEGYAAFSKGDIETAFSTFDDDIEWTGVSELLPAGGRFKGKQAVTEQWLGEVAENFEEFSAEPEEYFESGDHVFVLGTGRNKVKGGESFEAPFVHVWKFRDGKSISVKFFTDTAKGLKALQEAGKA